ncbi:hypothetical protein SAMD00019534_108290 [Acytostelium subglobosum LB1]|uniref:hypothetical protein n=1 Tax=Acytostelium subglobosum LB1 TaxID=1410327 RepID=UPI000644C588|nr:hypothetical protein SAMD00019534_108290 [Acytostelium subglobosum LB1]GAM27653.1 hypothetical protein SAMD00019534_108290 [Acytostelium subglobosum LB1]|eukprot:XP_012749312.1 hypothetical protein SAMD00019534_108290 [Acytostelium subglobosum LB1]
MITSDTLDQCLQQRLTHGNDRFYSLTPQLCVDKAYPFKQQNRVVMLLSDGQHYVPAIFNEGGIDGDGLQLLIEYEMAQHNKPKMSINVRLQKFKFTIKGYFVVYELDIVGQVTFCEAAPAIHPIAQPRQSDRLVVGSNTTKIAVGCNNGPLYNVVEEMTVYLNYDCGCQELIDALSVALAASSQSLDQHYFINAFLPLISKMLGNQYTVERCKSNGVYDLVSKLLNRNVSQDHALSHLDSALEERHWSYMVLVDQSFLNTLLTPLRATHDQERIDHLFEQYINLMINYIHLDNNGYDNIVQAFCDEHQGQRRGMINDRLNRWFFSPSTSKDIKLRYLGLKERIVPPVHLVPHKQELFDLMVSSVDDYQHDRKNVFIPTLLKLGNEVIDEDRNQQLMIDMLFNQHNINRRFSLFNPFIRSFQSCFDHCLQNLDNFNKSILIKRLGLEYPKLTTLPRNRISCAFKASLIV